MSFHQCNRRNNLTLDSVILINSCHEVNAMGMELLSSSLFNYKLKFNMKNCITRDDPQSPRAYQPNELVVKNSSLKTLDIFSVVSIEIQSSNAYFDQILVERVNQSVPIILSSERSFILINNSDFNNNTISHKMSAIIAANKSKVVILNSNFNESTFQNGAVVLASSSVVGIAGSVFKGNSVKSGRGLIYAVQSKINISDSTLEANKALKRCYIISARQSNVTMTGVMSFKNVGYNGGVLRACNRSYLHIHNNYFESERGYTPRGCPLHITNYYY